MKVIFLKNGKFALHPARGPVIICREGETMDLPDANAERLIEVEWAKEAEVEETEQGANPVAPWLADDWDPEADDVKDVLEAYGIAVFAVDINKRKSVKNLIAELEELGEA